MILGGSDKRWWWFQIPIGCLDQVVPQIGSAEIVKSNKLRCAKMYSLSRRDICSHGVLAQAFLGCCQWSLMVGLPVLAPTDLTGFRRTHKP